MVPVPLLLGIFWELNFWNSSFTPTGNFSFTPGGIECTHQAPDEIELTTIHAASLALSAAVTLGAYRVLTRLSFCGGATERKAAPRLNDSETRQPVGFAGELR